MGYVRGDRAPLLAADKVTRNDGFAMHGHIFAIGYLRGLIHALERIGEPGVSSPRFSLLSDATPVRR